MASELHLNEKVLWVAENASWDWYCKQLTKVVTPKDAVQYSISMSTGWTSDNGISNAFAYTLRTPSYLRMMEIRKNSQWIVWSILLIVGDLSNFKISKTESCEFYSLNKSLSQYLKMNDQ